MLKIKLFPQGKKHQRSFKIVVAQLRSKMNGPFVEQLGYWYPFTKTTIINQDRLAYWQSKGAQLATGVDTLLHPEAHPHQKKAKPVKTEQ